MSWKECEKIIIDAGTAGNDAITLLTALHYFKVESVTITVGNVAFNQQVENALYSIQVSNQDKEIEQLNTTGSDFFIKTQLLHLK